MRSSDLRFLIMVLTCALAMPAPAPATDVDGPNDCQRALSDFGDAPEGVDAYPGIPGRFPTCLFSAPAGTQEIACVPPLSGLPGLTGYVQHLSPVGAINYWLGCTAAAGPMGIDSEPNGKMNATGAAASACATAVTVDCVEAAFGMSFGQDECYGSTDAGVSAAITFNTCTSSQVSFTTYSCATANRQVYLNILVDMNEDADWNDNFQCPGACAYEWAVKNALIPLPPGCAPQLSPSFLVGPNAGRGWLRISISEDPMPDDFPWNGTAGMAGGAARLGETEDYPVTILLSDPCPSYLDFGDAPEEVQAYPGVSGHFPTCIFGSTPGTQTSDCAPISTAPLTTGYVAHRRVSGETVGFWLGCGNPLIGFPGVDGEANGKTNDTGGPVSICATPVTVDCVEAAFGMSFGQDECIGDDDAGIAAAIAFNACTMATVDFETYNCKNTQNAYLNILVDWNQDGDWNDNLKCQATGDCAYEWAVKNVPIALLPGCQPHTSPSFRVGPRGGSGWLRITVTQDTVLDDFPWNGSVSMPASEFRDGETEDYPVVINGPDPCPEYLDFGDAPEEVQAYPGVSGHFPTCIFGSTPGNQTSDCPPLSSPPATTGYVAHLRILGDSRAYWLGCGDPAAGFPGVDGEANGKMNDTGLPASLCAAGVAVDCVEAAFGMSFGQDECYGDTDAGIAAPLTFDACTNSTVSFNTFNCGNTQQVYLNILVDWNQDGDWNDNFLCPGPTPVCAYEWAVKNVLIGLLPGCQAHVSPTFLAGPNAGNGWLRITLTPAPVPVDFPWNGSVSMPSQQFPTGETEDYPVTISVPDPCNEGYREFGDAPEEFTAYTSGIIGHFPTCIFPGGPGTQEIDCGLPLSTPPGPTGFVMHVSLPTDPFRFWLGCAVDREPNGKTSLIPPLVDRSICDTSIVVDCSEPAYGMLFGQDECTGDADAGVSTTYQFPACSLGVVTFRAFNCLAADQHVYLNLLIDWSHDGDWNDVPFCLHLKECAPEWVVKNRPIVLAPGCVPYTTPVFRIGPKPGDSWMRLTLSMDPVPDDFPWNGSAGIAPDFALRGGETEDYPVSVIPSTVDATPPTFRGGLWMAPLKPNPSSRGTTARFALPREAEVALEVYDVSGRKLADLVHGTLPAGEHAVAWNFRDANGTEVPVGIYVIQLRVGNEVLTQRAIRIR